MKFDKTYGGRAFLQQVFHPAKHMAAGTHEVWHSYNPGGADARYYGKWVKPLPGREWFAREVSKHQLHPVIEHVIESKNYRPINWQQLLLEWPHRSQTDHNRLAYTQDERKGERDIQTVTTIGKYLQRHFVMPDHEIRDAVALFTSNGEMKILKTLDGILDAVQKGPTSCMSHDLAIRCDDGEIRHPYEVYRPELGWSMAVRINEGRIDGRALVYQNDNHHYFVRSYKRDLGGGYSYADERIESWLIAQGINKLSGWGDAILAAYSVGDGYLAPYLDGDDEYVRYDRDNKCLVVVGDRDGYHARETNGVTADAGEECEDCGERHDEDDMYWVGRHEDRRVGSCCIENYTYVYGRRGNQYYIDNDDAVYVDGDYYDCEYLSDNNIVELVCGNYSHIDNAVWIESCDAYYDCDDSDICYAEDSGRYELTEDCWMCEATNKWYTEDTEYVEVDGDKYHPDEAPEPAQTELFNNETN